MSDTHQNKVETLLPSSTVSVFSRDDVTRDVVEALRSDWRFARVACGYVDGDVEAAIQFYQDEETPDLIVIQTDSVDEGFTDKLEILADLCHEGTRALVIGPDNDVDLYRHLIDMGVEDYLVRPIKMPQFADVIGSVLIHQVGAGGSNLIAYVGAKGGVGCSSIAQVAALGCADILAQKTAFIDASGGWSTASVGLGFEPSATLQEAAKAAEADDEESLMRMLYKASDNLHILASGSDALLESAVSAKGFDALLDMLMVKYPVVIVDLSGASAKVQKLVTSRACHIVCISTPTLSSLRLARSFLAEAKTLRGDDDSALSLTINMQGIAAGLEVSDKDVSKVMEFKPASVIGYAPKVFFTCESTGQKITEHKEGAVILKDNILPTVRTILSIKDDGVSQEASGFLDGVLSRLKKNEG